MLNYSLKTVIPTESSSHGLLYNNKDIYFASNTYIYKITDNQYKLSGILNSNIRKILLKNNILYVITEDSLVLVHDNKNIASLKCDSLTLSINDKYIVLSNYNILEIWYIPKEYKFGMFDLHTKINIHNNQITCTFISDNIIYSGSLDCTVKYYDLKNKKIGRFINTKSVPINIFKINNEIIVICEEGQIYFVNEDTKNITNKIFKNTKILSSDYFDNLLCICIQDNNSYLLEIISDGNIIYGFECKYKINEISFINMKVAIKSNTFIGLYNFELDTFLFNLDLPKISCMDTLNELIGVGCTDKKIRIYDDTKLINTFYDDKNTHPIYKIYFLTSSILSISYNGYISIFDLKKGTCFRSINIPVKISSTCVCEDGMLMFISDYDTYKIRIIDLQRSREIDNLEGHESPVKNMKYYKNLLFSLSTDNELKKWDIYKNTCLSIDLEKTVINFTISNNKIYILLLKEILIYDLNLEYERSLYIKDNLSIEFISISFDNKLIFLGGESNKINILSNTNNIEQTLKVSRNKKWKNYKDYTYNKEINKINNKDNIIEVLDLKHNKNQYKINILSREGVLVYEKSINKYLSLNLDIETTIESITEYIKNKKYLNGLIASLKIKEKSFIEDIINLVPEKQIELIIKYIPENMIEELRNLLIEYIKNKYNIINIYRWMRYLYYYHGRGNNEQVICKKNGEETYKQTLENLYLLENLF